MKKVLFFAAVALVAASCSEDKFIGDVTTAPQDNSPSVDNAIVFSSASQGGTRADKVGADAAASLGNKFYVTGVKGDGSGTGQSYVFKTYSVEWATNTAGTTESNTSDWEYVGKTNDFASTLSISSQTIKYWDYNTYSYDFAAYSIGSNTLATATTSDDNKIFASVIDYGNATTGAYTLQGKRAALADCYITDMTTVLKADYNKEVKLQFRSLASKVRMAIYETVPGYSIKNVNFYVDDATTVRPTGTGDGKLNNTAATLFGDDAFYKSGTYTVSFPHIGKSYAIGGTNATSTANHPDYNKAHVTITGSDADDSQGFGVLNYQNGEGSLNTTATDDDIYLGRTSAAPSFAGTNPYYQTVLPNEDGVILEMRVNYTLVNNDGSNEEITIHGAKAFVPAVYTKWLPNYAYTYIFKISDNTNGWTDPTGTDPAGLFPITFDAVVLDPTNTGNEQTTITTVATPSITTYQKGHLYTDDNEYSAGKGNIYVRVMDNDANPVVAKADLNTKGKLYTVTRTEGKAEISEATVMDALNIVETGTTGRNGITVTEVTTTFPTAIAGIDGNDITKIGDTNIAANSVAMFTPEAPTSPATVKYYAYVYDATPSPAPGASDVYTAVQLTTDTAPEGFTTTYYVKKPDGSFEAASTYTKNDYYYLHYTNLNKVYSVKIIKVIN